MGSQALHPALLALESAEAPSGAPSGGQTRCAECARHRCAQNVIMCDMAEERSTMALQPQSYRKWWDFMGFYGGLMGFYGIYPLLNVYIAIENHIS